MARTLLDPNFSRSDQIRQIIGGYARMVIDRMDHGWTPYLLVLKFRHLGGGRPAVIAQMHDAAEGAYARLLFRVWKHPRARSVRDLRPVWVLCADVPGTGGRKMRVRDLLPNDGLHLQGIAVMPPGSRLREPLNVHLAGEGHRYCPHGGPLTTLHATPITSDAAYVNSYNFKSLRQGRANFDDVLILPRPSADLDNGPRRAAEPWRQPVLERG
ncbi:hypothetical protein MBRA_03812 [Methylobacterium brachiatum]|nr:hypothetical protein MBRA_03812 [Methylobacterium brachiatum]